MYNTSKEQNEKHIKHLINKEGYTDLGWANDGRSFTRPDKVRQVDCSLYAHRGTHKVYIDDINKEILRVDMSD